jgi:hypothetical protein
MTGIWYDRFHTVLKLIDELWTMHSYAVKKNDQSLVNHAKIDEEDIISLRLFLFQSVSILWNVFWISLMLEVASHYYHGTLIDKTSIVSTESYYWSKVIYVLGKGQFFISQSFLSLSLLLPYSLYVLRRISSILLILFWNNHNHLKCCVYKPLND